MTHPVLYHKQQFAGELEVRGERVPVQLSAQLALSVNFSRERLRPERKHRWAELDLRMLLPESNLLHVGGHFTRKLLTRAATELEGLVAGEGSTAHLVSIDYGCNLRFDRIGGIDPRVAVSGEFDLWLQEVKLSRRWRKALRQKRSTVRLDRLLIDRISVSKLSEMIREFLDAVGDGLREESIFD